MNVSLPVEAAAEAVSPAPARGPEEAWAEPQRSSPALAASGTYVMEVYPSPFSLHTINNIVNRT